MSGAPDLLSEHVSVLDAGVGGAATAVVSEDLRFPPVDRGGQARELGDSRIDALLEEQVGSRSSLDEVASGVDLAEELFGQYSGPNFSIRVAVCKCIQHRDGSVIAEPIDPGEQDSSASVERVTLATSMAERVLANAAADIVDRRIRELDGVEVVDHQRGIGRVLQQGAAIASGWIQRGQGDPGEPVASLAIKPCTQHVTTATLKDLQEQVTIQINNLALQLSAGILVW